MPHVLVTGSAGFVGRNLCIELERHAEVRLSEYDLDSRRDELDEALSTADVVYHLAGVNRPQRPEEFHAGNAGFTAEICDRLESRGRHPIVVLASSVQAELDNPYGSSKRAAEDALRVYCDRTGARGVVYRLKNLFGKWCRPNYNSVVATFCNNVARDLPIEISDPDRHLDLTYIDDVVAAYVGELPAVGPAAACGGFQFAPPLPSYHTTLGELAGLIQSFHDQRTTRRLPDFSDPFVLALYATYLSYLAPDDFAYGLEIKTDHRGGLAEFVKSPTFGQVFVSRTRPGITRGNHYHSTKTEKFLVVDGDAIIRFRHIANGGIVEYRVSGADFRVVDIPPGYTHSIENVGSGELVTLFWASEVLDPQRPDTYPMAVQPEGESS